MGRGKRFKNRGAFKIGGHEIIKKENAETADYSQNTQTGWECGDDANYVVYATIPARLIFLKSQADIVS